VSLTLDIHRHMVEAAVDVDLSPGHVTVLFGPSGSGKTTILRCVAGLDRIDAGVIRWNAETWDDARHRATPARQRHIGMLFQDHALFPALSVGANVAYGLPRLSRAARSTRVHEALAAVHADHLVDRARITGLSGGEAQRVALARALAPRPRLLLLDEPLSALDAPTRLALRGELRQVLTTEGIPSIVVTHDRSEALALGDTAVVLIDGRVHQTGPVAEVFDRPRDADVARVVGVETALPGTVSHVDEGLALVRLGSHALTAVMDQPVAAGDDVYVCIRAEDISIDLTPATSGTSPRNHLPATVTAVAEEGALVRIQLDAGVALTSLITRPAARELAIAPGQHVTAVVKSTAVHLVPRG
jgi:molybdate transport system ATP-binding protein